LKRLHGLEGRAGGLHGAVHIPRPRQRQFGHQFAGGGCVAGKVSPERGHLLAADQQLFRPASQAGRCRAMLVKSESGSGMASSVLGAAKPIFP
jgi:hypothetical protein